MLARILPRRIEHLDHVAFEGKGSAPIRSQVVCPSLSDNLLAFCPFIA
jgi:hypothetical protein